MPLVVAFLSLISPLIDAFPPLFRCCYFAVPSLLFRCFRATHESRIIERIQRFTDQMVKIERNSEKILVAGMSRSAAVGSDGSITA